MSGEAKILRYFQFPFTIFRLSFVIAGTAAGRAMTNEKCNTANGK
jgi:hypothetical protein